MKKRILFLLSVFIIAFGCSRDDSVVPVDDPIDSALLKAGKTLIKTIKFQKSTGTMQIDYTDYPLLHFDIQGSGNATHLGLFTVQNIGTVDYGVVPPEIVEWNGILTAANGDQLFTEMINGPYFMNGDGLEYYDYIIHSGTGRFEDVTGGEILTYGITDQVMGTWELEGEGTIIFNGP